jgi:hypothetical protein
MNYGTSNFKACSNKHVRETLIPSDVSKLFQSNRFEIQTKWNGPWCGTVCKAVWFPVDHVSSAAVKMKRDISSGQAALSALT